MGKERRLLGDESNASLAGQGTGAQVQADFCIGNVLAVDGNATGVGLIQSCDETQQSAFAGAGGTEDDRPGSGQAAGKFESEDAAHRFELQLNHLGPRILGCRRRGLRS